MNYAIRRSLLFALFCFSVYNVNAQKSDDNRPRIGNVMLSTAYGMPSALRMYLNREEASSNFEVRGYGPTFLKVDYMLLNKLSVGINGMYAYNDVYWTANAKDLNNVMKPYRHGVQVWEAAANIRVNYYFYTKNDWNVYAGVGAGLGYVNAETYALSPVERIYINHRFPTPYSFEGTIGTKYFFSNTIGLLAEFGVGQSWLLYDYYFIPAAFLQCGISVKL